MNLENRLSKLETAVAADQTTQTVGYVTSFGVFRNWGEAAADPRFPSFAEQCRSELSDDEKCKSLLSF